MGGEHGNTIEHMSYHLLVRVGPPSPFLGLCSSLSAGKIGMIYYIVADEIQKDLVRPYQVIRNLLYQSPYQG